MDPQRRPRHAADSSKSSSLSCCFPCRWPFCVCCVLCCEVEGVGGRWRASSSLLVLFSCALPSLSSLSSPLLFFSLRFIFFAALMPPPSSRFSLLWCEGFFRFSLSTTHRSLLACLLARCLLAWLVYSFASWLCLFLFLFVWLVGCAYGICVEKQTALWVTSRQWGVISSNASVKRAGNTPSFVPIARSRLLRGWS